MRLSASSDLPGAALSAAAVCANAARSVGIERPSHGNRQPLVPLDEPLVLQVPAFDAYAARLDLEQVEGLADMDRVAAERLNRV